MTGQPVFLLMLLSLPFPSPAPVDLVVVRTFAFWHLQAEPVEDLVL